MNISYDMIQTITKINALFKKDCHIGEFITTTNSSDLKTSGFMRILQYICEYVTNGDFKNVESLFDLIENISLKRKIAVGIIAYWKSQGYSAETKKYQNWLSENPSDSDTDSVNDDGYDGIDHGNNDDDSDSGSDSDSDNNHYVNDEILKNKKLAQFGSLDEIEKRLDEEQTSYSICILLCEIMPILVKHKRYDIGMKLYDTYHGDMGKCDFHCKCHIMLVATKQYDKLITHMITENEVPERLTFLSYVAKVLKDDPNVTIINVKNYCTKLSKENEKILMIACYLGMDFNGSLLIGNKLFQQLED